MKSTHSRHLGPMALLLSLALFLLACGAETGQGRGTVVSVDVEEHQITLDHGDIPGLMEAMVMPFDVDDPALLEAAEPGQEVVFDVTYDGRRYVVTSIRPAS